ncbi:uncharacterized protein RCO7_01198 [Rhynchosporium graminicola]|uniref:Uncharacterized protein n=1 Tax=Rhynchosporium graminicola TaxID=2792576 RepID=A0A1E1JRH2_9HELO|nr:uncharacterized protein RCO7_01198 [Rhynchosporium commune]
MADFMNVPSQKAARFTDDSWLKKSRNERDKMNRIWAELGEQHMRTLKHIGIGSEDTQSDMKFFSFANSSEHLAEVTQQEDDILAKIATKAAALQTHWGEEKEPLFEASGPKVKHKTRGPTDRLVSETGSPPEIENPELKPIVAVNKRALSVFKAMFPGDNLEDRCRAIDWDVFVNALCEEGVGFIARHSVGGSAYTLEPNEKSLWFGKGAISFHKLHPEHVIDAIIVMAHGKRMAKWFGWGEGTFVQKR